ncbi:hypothetical protein [Devosia sp. YR412]|uniref:hypothetical protein n=1 Tax=Devosia sp. YR412 TaxID=1881030 RepID=UPI00111418CB|nr:hypothetical protein [Devosia sp. YR412]
MGKKRCPDCGGMMSDSGLFSCSHCRKSDPDVTERSRWEIQITAEQQALLGTATCAAVVFGFFFNGVIGALIGLLFVGILLIMIVVSQL